MQSNHSTPPQSSISPDRSSPDGVSRDQLFRDRLIDELAGMVPEHGRDTFDKLIAHGLVSGEVLDLPRSLLAMAEKVVSGFFHLRRNPDYLLSLQAAREQRNVIDPGNNSICMSYDFHVDWRPGQRPSLKLIEINTNASFFVLSYVLYRANGVSLPVADFDLTEIQRNILTELSLFQSTFRSTFRSTAGPSLRVAIVDERPTEQRLYAEFLLYQSLFRSWGWSCEIQDIKEVSEDLDFIYNRCTDFYLSGADSVKMRALFMNRRVCFSPQPFEYLCLADKTRLIELAQRRGWIKENLEESEATAVLTSLMASLELTSSNAGQIWSQKKKWFFKPVNAFGGRQSYRGASVTRRTFSDLIDKGTIAQEYCTAPELEVPIAGRPNKFKYDLRFYAYQDRVQLAVARLYQGQVTNMKTRGGGFTCVRFID
ncbi:MAG: hypothetical protein C5B49_03470 [Bdellovibrio sp.]|nr:MAG: hypothetical protein C5B49_03470 [Bdellovibrio sp.]